MISLLGICPKGGGPYNPFRLELVRATRAVVARCLDLVGVEAPERM